MTTNIEHLSDETLIAETTRAAAAERCATVELLTLLVEVERRGVHLGLGHSSMFAFCTRALRLSEQAAYSRITAARTARRFPRVLPRLTDGAFSLSTVGLLAPHLTDESVDALLEVASYKSTRDVELDQVERTKCARSVRPRSDASAVGKGRHIPAAVRREVWRRDGGRCVFTSANGSCGETAFLEYHHVIPFAAGGSTDVANLQLRCRAHNAYENRAHMGVGVLFDRM